MFLREVAGFRYWVYAVCDEQRQCPIEDFLLEAQRRYPKAVRDLNVAMSEYAPQHGPPFEPDERAKKLRDGICEFRGWQKTKRQKRIVRVGLRVPFFQDGDRILCTSCFEKPFSGSTPDEEIDLAIELRNRYLREKEHNLIILRGWPIRG